MSTERLSTSVLRVERLDFGPEAAFVPQESLLVNATIAPLTPPLWSGAAFQAAIFRIAPGGGIGRHPATVPQILAVLEGSGRVSGADGELEPIHPGQAVFWAEGEDHETVSDDGLTALVLEAPGLEPYRRR
jgi:quercetin dioxygenase-like cupin family protein